MAFDGVPMGFYGEAVNFGVGSFLLPPSSQVAAYVCSSRPDESPQHIERKRVPTLKAAFSKVKASRQDYIVVLPGHTESGLGTAYTTTAGQLLVAGTTILGYGHGSLQPSFTWTGTTDTLAISVANVRISGLKFLIDGANDITKGINITGADCAIANCLISVSAATDLHAAIGIELGTAAHRFKFLKNYVTGISDAPTNVLVTAGAAPASDVLIADNEFIVAAHATNGLVNFAVANLRTRVLRNQMMNTTASSDFCLVYGDVAVSGYFDQNRFYVLNDGSAAAEGVSMGTAALVQAGYNPCSNKVKESGLLSPAASA